jgi:ABC-type polysaccharide/polyol phosphate export permease
MTITFLFRPIIGLDVSSRSSLFAAVENLLWSAGFIFIFFSILKKRKIPYFKSLLPSILFLILYSVGAGSYEGNMGTAFRHKSLVLWVVLLLIFTLAWRKPNELFGKPRNNSQESAV